MRKNADFKCRNSQAVQKAEASMVNTIWIRIKTASQSVNGCSIVENTIKRWRATRHGVMRYLLAIASITEIIKEK